MKIDKVPKVTATCAGSTSERPRASIKLRSEESRRRRLETASERRRAPPADLPGSKISAACRSWLARRSLYVREDGAGAKRTIKIRPEESRRRRLETASERRRAPPADFPGSKISAACRSWL